MVIGSDQKIKAMLTYPMRTARNFDETLRLLELSQLTAKHTVATPVNRRPGEGVITRPPLSNDAANRNFLVAGRR